MADQSQYWQQQPPQQAGWPPQQPAWPQPPGGAQTPGAGSEAAPPAPKAPTPLDPPAVYYNQVWRVPPLVVDTQEAADALDPNEWTTGAPPAAPGGAAGPADKPQWPQLYYNVNVSPRIVNDAQEAKSLGDEWQQFSLPDGLCKAAEANNAAKAKAAAAKAQSQSQASGQQQSQAQGQTPGYPQGG